MKEIILNAILVFIGTLIYLFILLLFIGGVYLIGSWIILFVKYFLSLGAIGKVLYCLLGLFIWCLIWSINEYKVCKPKYTPPSDGMFFKEW